MDQGTCLHKIELHYHWRFLGLMDIIERIFLNQIIWKLYLLVDSKDNLYCKFLCQGLQIIH